MPEQKYKKLGVLWKREAKTTNKKYLKGVLNLKEVGFDKDVEVICFATRKTKDTQPDLEIFLSEPKKGAPASAPKREESKPTPLPPDDDLL